MEGRPDPSRRDARAGPEPLGAGPFTEHSGSEGTQAILSELFGVPRGGFFKGHTSFVKVCCY